MKKIEKDCQRDRRKIKRVWSSKIRQKYELDGATEIDS